jgi:hypothetical protein
MPVHNRKYTLNEEDLTKRLMRPNDGFQDDRVTHDVDCIAAILTLRAGHTSNNISHCRAVFATTQLHS